MMTPGIVTSAASIWLSVSVAVGWAMESVAPRVEV